MRCEVDLLMSSILSGPRHRSYLRAMNIHHWSFHPGDDITRRLRALKREMTDLCLWHAFQTARKGSGNFDECLYERTMIWRYLPWKSRSITQDPVSEANVLWQEFREGLAAIFTSFERAGDARAFTGAAMGFVVPMYECEEQYEDANAESLLEELIARDAAMNWFGCFRYTAEPDRDRAEIHIGNNTAPDSPFADRRRKFAWMQQLLEDAARNAPEIRRIGTSSWLNNYAAYTELFPASYRDSFVAASPGRMRGLGWWGQFITHEVTLNEPRAERLKQEQRFELVQYRGTCEFEDLADHVAQQLSGL